MMSFQTLIRIAIMASVFFGAFHAQPAPLGANGVTKIWDCDFSQNACHFRNQYNLARFSRYHNPQRPFHNQRSVLVLDLSTQNARKFPGARLISHYFPARFTDACLYITYLLEGEAPRAFYVIQQDKENKCIFADENGQKSNQWREVQLQLDLSDGDPRFFLEAQYENNRQSYGNQVPGYIAISRFSFSYGRCAVNNANNCFADVNRPTHVQPPEAE